MDQIENINNTKHLLLHNNKNRQKNGNTGLLLNKHALKQQNFQNTENKTKRLKHFKNNLKQIETIETN